MAGRLLLPLLLAVAGCQGLSWGGRSSSSSEDKPPVTIAMLMMVRDEEANLRHNLPLWRDIIDFYVIGIDSKTTDDSERAIDEILPPSTPRSVYHFDFDGFGQARTLLFEEAWRHFPHATHVLIADPDWIPELRTIDKGEIDHVHDYFQFQIWDRNNLTTRQSDWLMRHREGTHMVYRLHEALVYPVERTITKEIAWEVYEVETPTSWHVKIGHSHSQSYKRYLFDLSLLEKDLADEGDSPSDHTLYYLGITHFALIEAGMATQATTPEERAEFAEEVNQRVEAGLHYLTERVKRHPNSPNWEQTWASMRWLAYSYQLFVHDFDQAEHWYQRCTAFDPERVDCPIFLARLYLDFGHTDKAWEQAVRSLSTPYPIRAFGNNFYIYDCFTPVEAAKTINTRMQDEGLDRGLFALGWRLIDYAEAKCDRGMILESDDVLDVLRAAYTALAYTQGLTPQSAASCLPEGRGVEKKILQKRLGFKVPTCSAGQDSHSGGSARGEGFSDGARPATPEAKQQKKTYASSGYSIGPQHWNNQADEQQEKAHLRDPLPSEASRQHRQTPAADAVPSGARPPAASAAPGMAAAAAADGPWWQSAWTQMGTAAPQAGGGGGGMGVRPSPDEAAREQERIRQRGAQPWQPSSSPPSSSSPSSPSSSSSSSSPSSSSSAMAAEAKLAASSSPPRAAAAEASSSSSSSSRATAAPASSSSPAVSSSWRDRDRWEPPSAPQAPPVPKRASSGLQPLVVRRPQSSSPISPAAAQVVAAASSASSPAASSSGAMPPPPPPVTTAFGEARDAVPPSPAAASSTAAASPAAASPAPSSTAAAASSSSRPLPSAAASSPSSPAAADGALSLDVIAHYLFKGQWDWQRRPFRALVVGDDDLQQLTSLARQLHERGAADYHITFMSDDRAILSSAMARRMSLPAPSAIDVMPLPTTAEGRGWPSGPFDYIAVSHAFNTLPSPPLLLFRLTRLLSPSEGGMSVSAFAHNSFLDAVQHLRRLLREELGQDEERARLSLTRFAEAAMIGHQQTGEGFTDNGFFRAAPRLLRSYRISDLYELLDQSGLRVVDVLGGIFYEPANYMTDDGLVMALDTLPPQHRFSMGEYLVPRSRHVLFAVTAEALDSKASAVGEVGLDRALLYDMVPMLQHEEGVEDILRQLQDQQEGVRRDANETVVLSHRIPFSSEVYEWGVSDTAARIIRAVDGRKSVLAIFDDVKSSLPVSSGKLRAFMDSFQSVWTVMNGLCLMVFKDPSASRSPPPFPAQPNIRRKPARHDEDDEESCVAPPERRAPAIDRGQELRQLAIDSLLQEGPSAVSIETLSLYGTPQETSDLLREVFLQSIRSSRLSEDLCDGCRPISPKAATSGAGLDSTTIYKLEHDIEQLEYLASRGVRAYWLNSTVIPAYKQVLSSYAGLLSPQSPIALAATDKALIGTVYNRAIHVPDLPLLPANEVLNPRLDFQRIQREYYSTGAGFVVVDDILTPKALSLLHEHLASSTLWFESKPTIQGAGYVGAYLDDGLHQPLYLQIAEALRQALPGLLGDLPLHYLWAYKHDQRFNGVQVHADDAAVNVNLWITPTSANLDPNSGGLVVYKTPAPEHWDFVRFNRPNTTDLDALLGPSGYGNYTVPYRANRIVIFNSNLFHKTDVCRFRGGYRNRRINLTFLYGRRKADELAL